MEDNLVIKEIINESKGIQDGQMIFPPEYLKNQIFHDSPMQKRKRLNNNPKYSPHQGARERLRRIKG